MDKTEEPFLLVRVGSDDLYVNHTEANLLSQWLHASARTASAETVDTFQSLSLKFLQAITHGESIVELTREERTALLSTTLTYMTGPTRLGNLRAALRAAQPGAS
jgi:hypothetical protein